MWFGMEVSSDAEGSADLSIEDIDMSLTRCGLLPEQAEELARLYQEHGTWKQVEEVWFGERIANRSTRDSSQGIYSVLTSRFKQAPSGLPRPGDLPVVLDMCSTSRDKAQVLYPYLVADDALMQYAVYNYSNRFSTGSSDSVDFSNGSLMGILDGFEQVGGAPLDYADSTLQRWCEGFRSVMRKIGVIESEQSVTGSPPMIGKVPLLVAVGYSYDDSDDDWFRSPTGLRYLFQPESRWNEFYDRAAETDAWRFVELHGSLRLRPEEDPYSWIEAEVDE